MTLSRHYYYIDSAYRFLLAVHAITHARGMKLPAQYVARHIMCMPVICAVSLQEEVWRMITHCCIFMVKRRSYSIA